ncbi:pyridoxamine 5'-phosphate oxidase family protein [Kitasatospora aureofaciens]|uniref:pyridoxamine 5'-phosphate oxidase family protein n=1 Tax=Kitasatospora aureofaciens TaxID=1894 RepID=UPI001C4647DD|nr:pyridoxamine 5'-phosphate oxidase family protein [Kitasatospora aureofaciens]MBV6701781.1 pyridoxamine 5'-phosphate oxidase family protein [Kitasatospora aureofaciens]
MLPTMSRHDREQFLADRRVGVLGVVDPRGGDRAPLVVPVWYGYEAGGEIVVQTGRETVKGQLLRAAGRFSLCVQDERRPYRYVSVEGPVVAVEDPVPPAVRENLAHRYLDPDEARAYLAATAAQLKDDVLFRLSPQRWRTADFAAFAADFAEPGADGAA